MATIRVIDSIDDLAADLRTIATSTPRRMAGVVGDAAKKGNRLAKAHAEEDHTMHSDVDADYAPTFTAERITPLVWEYGSDHPKASGYELGSVNQASPHRNLDRSLEVISLEYPLDVSDEMRFIWQEAGF
jgi:hypothetical protein